MYITYIPRLYVLWGAAAWLAATPNIADPTYMFLQKEGIGTSLMQLEPMITTGELPDVTEKSQPC